MSGNSLTSAGVEGGFWMSALTIRRGFGAVAGIAVLATTLLAAPTPATATPRYSYQAKHCVTVHSVKGCAWMQSYYRPVAPFGPTHEVAAYGSVGGSPNKKLTGLKWQAKSCEFCNARTIIPARPNMGGYGTYTSHIGYVACTNDAYAYRSVLTFQYYEPHDRAWDSVNAYGAWIRYAPCWPGNPGVGQGAP